MLNWKNEYYRYHRYFFNLRKTAQTPKVRSFTWLSVSIFTVVFFAVVAIKPTFVTIAKLNKETKDKKEANRLLQKKIDSIVAAQKEFARRNDDLYLIEEALPSKNEFPVLAKFLEEKASAEGLTIKALTFEKVDVKKINTKKTVSDALGSINFAITVSGNYRSLKNYLNYLENSRRLIKIENTTFSVSKKENEQELLLLIFGLAFFQPENI